MNEGQRGSGLQRMSIDPDYLAKAAARPNPCATCSRNMKDPAVGIYRNGDVDMNICPRCYEQEMLEAKADAAAESMREMPPHYRWATSDAAELAERIKPTSALERLRSALSGSLGLLGPAGVGKTSGAVMNAHLRTLRQDGRQQEDVYFLRFRLWHARFVTSMCLARARSQHKLGAGEAGEVEEAVGARLLVLDELGAEQGRDSATAEVIHRRHEADLPTIWTSPFTREELKAKYGDGIVRRLWEGATIIQLGVRK